MQLRFYFELYTANINKSYNFNKYDTKLSTKKLLIEPKLKINQFSKLFEHENITISNLLSIAYFCSCQHQSHGLQLMKAEVSIYWRMHHAGKFVDGQPNDMRLRQAQREGWGDKITSADKNCEYFYKLIQLINIIYSKMKTNYVAFMLLIMLSIGQISCQDYNWQLDDGTTPKEYDATEGSMYRHIYVTPIFYAPNPAAVTSTGSWTSATKTISAGSFDSTQTISYATSLIDFSVNLESPTSKQVIIWVQSLDLNAARTSMTITVQFTRPGLADYTTYKRFGFNTILIGSNFNLESSPLPSAYARNSKLVDVTAVASALDKAQFDFASPQNQPSPFAFVPDATKCGVSTVGGVARIQVLGCSKPIIVSFVTGFDFNVATATSPLDVSSFVVPNDATATAIPDYPGIVSALQTTSTLPAYLYQSSSTDQIVGPIIMFDPVSATADTIVRVQLSMVFVGLRSFTTTYPTGTPDSFIVAVSAFGYGTTDTLTTTATSSMDGLKTPVAQIDLWDYVKNSDLGHAFCGLQRITSPTLADFIGDEMDLRITLPTVTTAPQALEMSTTAASAEFPAETGACILFATKSTCVGAETLITSPSYTTDITPSAVTVGGQTFTQSPAGTWTPTKSMYTYNVAGLSTAPSRTSILKTYTVTGDKTEYVFYYDVDPATLAAGQLQVQVMINGVSYPPVPVTTDPTFGQVVFHVPASTTSIATNLTLIGLTTGADAVIQEGLYQYSNVVNNGQCVTSCPAVANFTTGVDPTSNPPACLQCDASLNLVYSNGICACKPYYFVDAANADTCQPCSDPLCVTCTTTATACTMCAGNATLITSGTTPTCSCFDGFYRSGSLCVACPIGCATCTSPTACLTCANSVNTTTNLATRENSTLNCRCLQGFYDVNTTAVCAPCSPLCATCFNTATNCTSCNTAGNFVAQQNSCVCAPQFYLLGTTCVACSPICKTCNVASIYCLSCPDMRVLAGTSNPAYKTCNCNTTAGYVEVDNVCVDATCSDIDPYCRECSLDLTGLRLRTCYNCMDNRVYVQNKCVCAPGYYETADKKCLPCGAGCQQCTNTTVCLSCASASTPNGDGTCSCRTGSLLIVFANGLYCQPCSINCASCSGTSSNCTSCKNGMVLRNGACVCPVGTYPSTDGLQCIPCVSKCDSCVNGTSCDRCSNGYLWDNVVKQCTLNCLQGFFNAGSQCTACPTGCSGCFTELICSACLPGFFMYAGSCRTVCPEGTYASAGNCYPCAPECKTCSSATQCNSCESQYVLLANKCVNDCLPGTFYGAGSCRACDPTCTTCTGYSTFCTSCPSPLLLYNNACYTTCPVATVNGVCTSNCPAGSFLSGTTCAACDATCRTCVGIATNCTSCASGLSSNGVCISTCPSGFFASNGFCSACDISCATCSGTPFTCTQCAAGFIRTGSFCIKSCPVGYFFDVVSSACVACAANCAQCTSAVRCTVCIDPLMTPVNGFCQRICPAGASPIGNTCVCNFGVLHQSACVSACPDGFYATADRVCAMCTSPCFTCAGSATNCASCITGYTYNDATKTCTQSSTCPYGAFRNANGVCQRYCPTSYFYNSGCIFSCPTGFAPNEYWGCVQSVSPTFCQVPTFLQGSTCVQTCLTGYFPNSVTRTCDRCFANCQQCLSATACVTCATGYILNSDRTACVQSSACQATQVQYNSVCYNTCPIGTYQSGQICIRSCPASTYFYQEYCYPTCPAETSFSNPDACLTQCPAGLAGCGPIVR